MLNVNNVACAAAIVLSAGSALASTEVKPTVSTAELSPLAGIELVEFPPVKIQRELEKDLNEETEGKPRRFAVPNDTLLTPDGSGVWEEDGAGNAVWRLRLSADNARSLNVGFTDFNLPEKARVFLYNEDMTHIEGPYTHEQNNEYDQFWTPVIEGEDLIVELTVPMERFHDVRLQIGRVSAAYRDFGLRNPEGEINGVAKSGSCNLDVVCGAANGFPEVDQWRGQIPAVGAYTLNGFATCTGSLVNNTAEDGRPLFLTAGHCGVQNNPGSIVVYWNYENPTCRQPFSGASGNPISFAGFPSTSGSTLLMTTGGSITGTPDHCLVDLNTTTAFLDSLGLTWNGWDRRNQDWSSVVTIHHPGVDEKRISFEDQPVTRTSYLSDPSAGPNATHWRIEDWDTGTTEGGSSGSPLFNPDQRVIGVLSGGFASCTSQTEDWYGRTFIAWDGSSPANRLRDHLDPLGLNPQFIDGRGAGPAPFLFAGPLDDITASGNIGGPFNGGTGSVTLTNSTDASANYTVAIAPGGTAPINLVGATAGTIPVDGTATINIELNTSVAAMLGAGVYTSTVVFTDTTNSQVYERDVNLEVGRVEYVSADVPVDIPDEAVRESVIVINDDICISDLNVSVDIEHTYFGDLDLFLTGPDGTSVRLKDADFIPGIDIIETYDDEGPTPPAGPGALSDFDDSSAQGTWTLRMDDNFGADEGQLRGWSLSIASTGNPCGFVPDPTGACCVADVCSIMTAANCAAMGGTYQGDDTTCAAGTCTPTNSCIADFNNDGVVNLGDFGAFGAAFGSSDGDDNWDPNADFNGDGSVNLGDFGAFGAEFGRDDCLD